MTVSIENAYLYISLNLREIADYVKHYSVEDIGCLSVSLVSFSVGVVMFMYRAPVLGGLPPTLSHRAMRGKQFMFGPFDTFVDLIIHYLIWSFGRCAIVGCVRPQNRVRDAATNLKYPL